MNVGEEIFLKGSRNHGEVRQPFPAADRRVCGGAGWDGKQERGAVPGSGCLWVCLCSVGSLSILHLTPASVWKISSLQQVYYRYMLATMCIITVSIMWPRFCRVSVIVMISFPTRSVSSLSGFIFQQKPFFVPFSLSYFHPFSSVENDLLCNRLH